MLAVVFVGGGAAFGRGLVGGGERLVVRRDVSDEDRGVSYVWIDKEMASQS